MINNHNKKTHIWQNKFFFFLLLIANNLITQQSPSQGELNEKLVSFCPWPGHPPANPKELETVLVQGADPNYIINPYAKETLLDKIASNDAHNEHIKILINHCKHTNQQLKVGDALHHTVCCAAILNATALLEASADVNAFTFHYDTPLQLLILYSTDTALCNIRETPEWPIRLQMVKLFLDHGARIDILPEKKRTGDLCSPLQLALNKKLPEFVQLFRQKIAEPEYKKLRELKTSHSDSYISLLPLDLLQELSYMMSNDEFLLQQKGRP